MALAGSLRAGQIEAPVSGEFTPGNQTGVIGSNLGAPAPIQLLVPALTGGAVPTITSAISIAPVAQTNALRPIEIAAIPVLPMPAVPIQAAKAAASPATKSGPPSLNMTPDAPPESNIDAGRTLFDQGADRPTGFNRGNGQAVDPNLLPPDIYSPQIMLDARRSGRVFEVNASNLNRMKPGVQHNFVIVKNPDGTIVMTMGRLDIAKETGVKHVALGDGRAVLFSGGARIDPATGRPVLDFNSGMYSRAGLDARWAPTPDNARALAAHAEAILRTPVDIQDHFTKQLIEFRTAPPNAVAQGGVLGKIRNFLSLGEAVPAWPGKADDIVRIGRVKTALGHRAGDGGTSTVWQSRDRNYAIKILYPGARDLPGVNEEAATLRAIAGSDLPVAKLIAESRDGSVQVKEFVEGESAYGLMTRGVFARQHVEGWPELAAKLIRAGVTADLAPGNLIWQHWRSRWMIVDAGELKDGGPGEVLKQLLTPNFLKAGLDAGAFLSGLRARLGPDSPQWAKTLTAMGADPALAKFRSSLTTYDARRTNAPAITFAAAPKASGGLDDSVVSPRELNKRLGYDPTLTKVKIKLHGDDPGKLNTVILSVEEPGKPKLILKTAGWNIIRNEAAARRLARRFFGRYFRVPASLSVQNGFDSYMAMEKADATPSYYKNAFTLEQRVAVALFIRTFGISDVNQGNVLVAHDGDLPWIIDFEQAFGRAGPDSGRHIPDERIALEKPWMSLQARNHIEDYQLGIRAWRAEMAKPENQRAIQADLEISGFTKPEAELLLTRFNANAADLDWTLQNDADFVNQFVDRNAAHR